TAPRRDLSPAGEPGVSGGPSGRSPFEARPPGLREPASSTAPLDGLARTALDQRARRTAEPSEPLEVGVLGPVVVRGAERAFDRRPTLTELVAYLALHRDGATTATWSTAVWPDRRVPMQTVANRLSEARRALGHASDGLPRLRRVADRHVIVDVSTDWERFVQLSRSQDPADWRCGLALVRGRPFVNLRSGYWTVLEGLDGEMVAAVTSSARSLAEHLLAGGDVDGASWAAHQGLRVAPWDERLHRILMRVADAAGDRAGVDAVLRQLGVLLEIDGDPLRGVHPQTAALYARLTSGLSSPASGRRRDTAGLAPTGTTALGPARRGAVAAGAARSERVALSAVALRSSATSETPA
ncbi:MAG TPA: bacterial transcriptional activator domain-containing protein, partial [Acidimicrobiales bacterium]|nr:bacterial transcriptional activator domain-containing protein [Acidimicrobiales bacterium]